MRSPNRRVPLGPIAVTGVLLVLWGGPVRAQAPAPLTIDPGMTKEQVIARLGMPSGERHSGGITHLYYENGCAVKCGIDDLVVLENDIVTDAIFHSPARAFSGVSSSPQPLPSVAISQFTPEPLRASTSADTARRGGIVFSQRYPIAQPSRYTRIVPNRADSAKMATQSSPVGAPTSATDSAPPAPH